MARLLPNLNALRAFEAAARHQSFSRAARELLVTQGAISRQVKALERSLGTPLFVRRGRLVELTDEGRDYLAATNSAFDIIEQSSRRITEGGRRAVLTANVLPTFAMRWLIPRLPDFAEHHPEIEVHLITSIEPVDFERGNVDVAIRVGATPAGGTRRAPARIDLQMVDDWSNVRADFLMPDILVPVCNPVLLARHRVTRPADLFALRLLHNATRVNAWPDWFAAQNVPYRPGADDQSYGHFFMSLQAALEGRGVALVPSALTEDDVDAGRLAIPFDFPVESQGDYYLLCRSQQYHTDRIRRFREWLLGQTGFVAVDADDAVDDMPRRAGNLHP
jgi:LysR family glycine cleavage system transcriptional activator